MAFSDARNEKERAEGDKSGRSSGGGGDRARQAERRNREAMDRNKRGGGSRASGMSATAADHMVAMGKIGTPSIPGGGVGVAKGNYATQDDAYNDYAKAVGKYDQRGFFDKALDWLGGGFYDPKEPMAGNPRSFAGGDFHSTTNPGSVLGGIAGMFAGPAGTVISKAAGPAYTAAGLPEIWHGGYDQPDYRGGPLGNAPGPIGGSFADLSGGRTYPSGSSPGLGLAGNNNRPLTGGGTGNNTGGGLQLAGQPRTAPMPGRPALPGSVNASMGTSQAFRPGAYLSSGMPGYGTFRPGYDFIGPARMQAPVGPYPGRSLSTGLLPRVPRSAGIR